MPRVVSWNMLGGGNWTYMRQMLTATDPDVLCVQECGQAPYNFTPTGVAGVQQALVNFGTADSPLVYEIYHWANPSTQYSLAILTRITPTNLFLNAAPAIAGVGAGALRPILGIGVNLAGANWTIGNLHAPSVFSATGPQIVAYGQAAYAGVAAAAPMGAPWACLGDWNTSSAALLAGIAGNAAVNAPYATHQGGYAIDYLVTTNPMPAAINPVGYSTLPFAADHVPVAFQW